MRGYWPSRNTGQSCLHELKKRWRKVEDGKTYDLFLYLLDNLIFRIFLKEESDSELMTSLSSELKNFKVLEKRVRTPQCLFDNMVDGRPGNFLYCYCYSCIERVNLRQIHLGQRAWRSYHASRLVQVQWNEFF